MQCIEIYPSLCKIEPVGATLVVSLPEASAENASQLASLGTVQPILTATCTGMFAEATAPATAADATADDKKRVAQLHAYKRFLQPSRTVKEMGIAAPPGMLNLPEAAKKAANSVQQGVQALHKSVKSVIAYLKDQPRSAGTHAQLIGIENVLHDVIMMYETAQTGTVLCPPGCAELVAVSDFITRRCESAMAFQLHLESLGGHEAGLVWSPVVYAAYRKAYDDFIKFGQYSFTEYVRRELTSTNFKAAAAGVNMQTCAGVAANSTLQLPGQPGSSPAALGQDPAGGGGVSGGDSGDLAAKVDLLSKKIAGLEFVVGMHNGWNPGRSRYQGQFVGPQMARVCKSLSEMRATLRMPVDEAIEGYGSGSYRYGNDKPRSPRRHGGTADKSPTGRRGEQQRGGERDEVRKKR